MPQWKVISQRNFLKGLQATFGLFSQPASILTRLSNLLYDRRGALRTTDGSLVFTQRNGAKQSGDGPLTELVLYSPPGVNAYYVGIQKSYVNQIGSPSALTATPFKVGGTITSISRTNGIVTLVVNAGHNLTGLVSTTLANCPFNPGNMVVAGVGGSGGFNGLVPFDTIAVTDPITITYPQAGADATGTTSSGPAVILNTVFNEGTPGTTLIGTAPSVGPSGQTWQLAAGDPTATASFNSSGGLLLSAQSPGPTQGPFIDLGVADYTLNINVTNQGGNFFMVMLRYQDSGHLVFANLNGPPGQVTMFNWDGITATQIGSPGIFDYSNLTFTLSGSTITVSSPGHTPLIVTDANYVTATKIGFTLESGANATIASLNVTATAATSTLGTQLAPGNYSYNVTACDGLGGETLPAPVGASVAVVAPNNAVLFAWAAGTNDSNYSLYGTSTNRLGRLNPGVGALQIINGLAYADIGLLSVAGVFPPSTNTTQTCIVYRIDAPAYSVQLATLPPYILPLIGGIAGATSGGGSGNLETNIFFKQQAMLPASSGAIAYSGPRTLLRLPPGDPGGFGGGPTGTGSGGSTAGTPTATASAGAGPSPVGGVPGSLSPLPQIVQFTGKLIFALGNGFPPQEYADPSVASGGFKPVSNNFTSTYPDWQPSVVWNQGDQIKDSISGGIFTATQGGISGATRPPFINQLNRVTADNAVAWTCVANKFAGTPLRGAAHAVVYAGSLWILNTWPTTTSDQLDGPNCVKMSDVNNPDSWNPVNVAFIARDDGDQIMGAATFTIAESGISPTGSLVIFKNFSTYQISGVFGAIDFSIQQSQTDLGCIAPRSIQFAPGYGIMRMTHLGVAYFNGVSDKIISEEIRPYLFGGLADIQPIDWNYIYFAKAAQAANPPMYILAAPILANGVGGVTIAPGSAPTPSAQFTIYARVSELTLQADGTWLEVAITPEQTIVSGDASLIVTTAAAISGIQYRLYAGVTPGGENLFAAASSFTAQRVTLSSMAAGAPSISNGSLTRLMCYDLVQKVWAIIDLPFPISAIKQIRAPGTIPLTIAGGFSDGQIRRLFAGDITWDTGSQVKWRVRGAELFQDGGSSKVYFRRLIVRGQDALSTSVSVTVALSGVQPPAVTAQNVFLGTDQWEFTVDILADTLNANAEISGEGPISIDSLDWHVKPKATGAPVSIQK